jgi:predicted flap endonuclease-1-like 5' DNA nuclease
VTYTLITFAVWLVAAAICGAVVGWFVRPRQSTTDDAAGTHSEHDVERLRAQLAQAIAQRDQLAAERLDPQPSGTPTFDQLAQLETERDHLQASLDGSTKANAELRARVWNAESQARELQAVLDAHLAGVQPTVPDCEQAAAVLGHPLVADDLTAILGLTASCADALTAKGISSWWVLANADLDLLRSTLAAAGLDSVDPSTWPHQARLLSLSQWDRFKTFADTIRREGLLG